MRYPVEMIVDLLSSGMSWSEIIEDYPAIEENDIRACLLLQPEISKINNCSIYGEKTGN